MVASAVLVVASARAEKAVGYVAPPYALRFARSLVFAGVIGAAIAGILFALQLWIHRGNISRHRKKLYLLCVVAIAVFAAFIAAADNINDEGWNPSHISSFFIALLLPLAILLLAPSPPSWIDWLVAIALTPLFFWGLRYLLFFVQNAGFDLSW